jgi:hypothetical protein
MSPKDDSALTVLLEDIRGQQKARPKAGCERSASQQVRNH